MKIRNGFVSNSSSSSFCIYGLEVDTEPRIPDDSFLEYEIGLDNVYGGYALGVYPDFFTDRLGMSVQNVAELVVSEIQKIEGLEYVTIKDLSFLIDGCYEG